MKPQDGVFEVQEAKSLVFEDKTLFLERSKHLKIKRTIRPKVGFYIYNVWGMFLRLSAYFCFQGYMLILLSTMILDI